MSPGIGREFQNVPGLTIYSSNGRVILLFSPTCCACRRQRGHDVARIFAPYQVVTSTVRAIRWQGQAVCAIDEVGLCFLTTKTVSWWAVERLVAGGWWLQSAWV